MIVSVLVCVLVCVIVCVIVCGCRCGWLSRWVRKGVHFAWHTHGPASKEPIRFVQHDADDPSQPVLLLVVTKELRQPARRRDHDVRPASELRRLSKFNHNVVKAARAGNLQDMEENLKEGDINFQDNYGWTPLMWATYRGNLDCVEALIARGATSTKNRA